MVSKSQTVGYWVLTWLVIFWPNRLIVLKCLVIKWSIMRKKWVLWIYIVIWMKKFDLDDKTFLKMGDCGVK